MISDKIDLSVPKATAEGLSKVVWPGRAHMFVDSTVLKFFLDGAHTTESIANCLSWFLKVSAR